VHRITYKIKTHDSHGPHKVKLMVELRSLQLDPVVFMVLEVTSARSTAAAAKLGSERVLGVEAHSILKQETLEMKSYLIK
jgi:hypothetical protein